LVRASVRLWSDQHVELEQRVTPLELFFDLAFVFALLLPVVLAVPALVALVLVLVAAVWVALHAYEIIWWRGARLPSC
jgi:low temperature requirement protein LtrA